MPADIAPADESIVLPESVRRAAAAAEAIHKQAYQTPDAPAAPAADASAPTPASPDRPEDRPINIVAEPAPTPPVPPVTAQQQPPAPPVVPAAPDPATPALPADWEHRYNSMKGRYEQASHTIGSMQHQMQEMGDELTRMHALLSKTGHNPAAPNTSTQPLITEEDVKAYGPDLIDVVRRAAVDAVRPELSAVEQEIQKQNQRNSREARQRLYTTITDTIPNWQEINRNPRFLDWLRLRDVYSGAIRQAMLKQAFQGADAPRVIAFFKGFLDEEVATGQVPAPTPEPHAAPRIAAVPLATLVAPGAARPATGDTQVPVDKPIYTHAQIATFYNDVRRGAYAGRQEVKDRLEHDIFAAQREGRVR